MAKGKDVLYRIDGGVDRRSLRKLVVGDRPIEEMKFWNGTPCIPWCGCRSGGYGLLSIKNKTHNAHRAIYQNIKGQIPDGMVVDHLCKNKSCVNPDHMEVVTDEENVRRGDAEPSKNARKLYCKRGHALSGDNVIIRRGRHRECATCRNITHREWRAKRKNKESHEEKA